MSASSNLLGGVGWDGVLPHSMQCYIIDMILWHMCGDGIFILNHLDA